ncbi:hypothetical protein LguiB_009675 [Lonicera macranthoides]
MRSLDWLHKPIVHSSTVHLNYNFRNSSLPCQLQAHSNCHKLRLINLHRTKTRRKTPQPFPHSLPTPPTVAIIFHPNTRICVHFNSTRRGSDSFINSRQAGCIDLIFICFPS